MPISCSNRSGARRMNVGQSLKPTGWPLAARQADWRHARRHARAGQGDDATDAKEMRVKLKDIYGDSYFKEIDAARRQHHGPGQNWSAAFRWGNTGFDGAREPMCRMLEGRAPTIGPGDPVRRPQWRAVSIARYRGYIYMLKLTSGRRQDPRASIGPYSLVTSNRWRQGQFGGQRCRRNGSVGAPGIRRRLTHAAGNADREVYDVIGRTKVYEAIVKGERHVRGRIPESFNGW